MSFTYNDGGIRTSKTVNGVTTTYYLDGSRIVGEETNGNITVYFYDSLGLPIGFGYHASTYASGAFDVYWYEKNLQGDIVAIYNQAGTKIVSYYYDAWGACYTTNASSSVPTVVTNNPFRYRGYYYDIDLGLYYLNARYYDLNTGRFINVDSYVNGNGDIIGFNLFVYCSNNPIMFVDPSGKGFVDFFEKWWDSVVYHHSTIQETNTKVRAELVLGIVKDIQNYDSENTDEEKVLEANFFSSYKGTLVIKTRGDYALSFGVILLGRQYEDLSANTVRHEFGHRVQLDNMGLIRYIYKVAIPSVIANKMQDHGLPFDYYSSPWESEADYYGGATRQTFKDPWTEEDGYIKYIFR